MQTPSPAPIEYVSNLKRALIYGQITEKDFYPFSPLPSGRSFLSSTVPGTQTLIDQTYRAWAYGQMSSAIVQDPNLLSTNDSFGGPAPADFVDDLRRSLLYGGLTYTDLGGFYIPPYGATFWRDFTKFQTLNHGTGIPLTYTRSGPASYIGSDGQMKIAQVDEPRFDFDPVTLECKGLLCEVTRKNFVFQSAVGVSQGPIFLTSGTYTLSFYGTGNVTITGAASVNLTGSGAYPVRSSVTFTATSANISVLVTGTVQYLQIESGAFATSWIPTGDFGSTNNIRGQDLIVSSSDGLPTSVFNVVQGTLYCSFSRYNLSLRAGFLQFRGGSQDFVALQGGSTNPTAPLHEFRKRPSNQALDSTVRNLTSATVGTIYKLAGTYDNTIPQFKLFQNGVNVGTVLTSFPNLPVNINTVAVGRVTADGSAHGWIREVSYMPTALSDTDLADLTT